MTTCTLKGCAGLTGFLQTGLDSWSIYCPVCDTLTPADAPRTADDADWEAARALSHLRNARWEEAEQGFVSAAGQADGDDRRAFYLWLSLLSRYGVRYVQEVQFESLPAKRTSLFLPTFGRFPLPDTDLQQADAYHQLAGLLKGHPMPETEKRLEELQTLLSEIAVCLKSRQTRSDVFIAWHDRPEDPQRRCSGLADRLNTQLNLSKECYSFVSFKDLTGHTVDHYEPHIYAALAAAKAMVVIVDDYDALGQKFLRSEIERFLGRKRQDDSLRLYFCGLRGSVGSVPAYIKKTGLELHRDDAENTGHCAELIKTVVLNILREQRRAAAAAETPKSAPAQPSVGLEEAMMPVRLALSSEDWATAKALLTALPVEQKTSAEYYLYSLLIQLELKEADALGDCLSSYETSEYWKQALHRSDPRMKAHLRALLRTSIVGRLAAVGITARRDGEGGIDLTDGKTYARGQLVIPEGVTRITQQAFRGNKTLTRVTIPASVHTIEHGAFCESPLLESVQLNEGVRRLENGVFNSCPKLTAITLPESLTDVQGNPFNGSSVAELTVAEGNPELYMEGGALLTRSGRMVALIDRSLTEYRVPDHVKVIGKWAFYRMKNLQSVSLPKNLEAIEEGAFAYCAALNSMVIPAGVTAIEDYTFTGCTGLTAVRLPVELRRIGRYGFCGCEALRQIQLPTVFAELDEYTFSGCTALEQIALPAGVRAIPAHAFSECTSLKAITMPDGLHRIGDHAFEGCTALADAQLPALLETIGESAFRGCTALPKLRLPDSLRAMGDHAFENCTSLGSAVIPGGVSTIGTAAFKGCGRLKELWLTGGLHTIGESAFEDCTGLKKAGIPNTVELIGKAAFKGCTGLSELKLLDSLHTIGDNAFENCEKLTAAHIPETVEVIGKEAFRGCAAMESLRLPKRMEQLGEAAFHGCKALHAVIVPEGLKALEIDTFRECSGLTTAQLPESLRSIGAYAFYECEHLLGIHLHGKVETIGEHAFQKCLHLASLRLPESLRVIGRWAFIWCESLPELSLPYGLTHIGDSAFYGCKGLKTIAAPPTIIQIDNDAFNVRGNLLFKYKNQSLPAVTAKKGSYAEKFFQEKRFPVSTD